MRSEKGEEIRLKGIAASPGISIGHVLILKKDGVVIEERTIEDTQAELLRLERAIEKSTKELEKIYSTAFEKIGKDKARIFEAQLMMLSDPIFVETVKKRISSEQKNAEYIVADEVNKQTEMLRKSDSEIFKLRALEIEDVKNRIIRNLSEAKLRSRFEGNPIIVATELSPADAVLLSRNAVLGYASDYGGARSHASILARSLGIPAVVALRELTRHVKDGDEIILDGYRGTVVVNPTPETMEKYVTRKNSCDAFDSELLAQAAEPGLTTDGHRVKVEANLELLEELQLLKGHGAEGIGLFRTEPMIIDLNAIPDEDYQFETLRQVVEAANPNPVVIRTFDIGGDKLFVEEHSEPNPFLGWRGIRMLLDRPDVLKDQLRAILRASAYGKCKIMFPMVATVEEVVKARKILDEVKYELDSKGIKYDKDMEVGVMIEIPSAALMSKEIAKHVDFLSIGTNDLVQYLLAVDRTNELVANLFDEFHPAVIRTIKYVIDAGHEAGISVAMCGEMAGNPLATAMLLGMGLDEFSAVSSVLPVLKKIVRETNYKSARKFARQILKLESSEQIRKELREYLKQRFERIYYTTISEENFD
jgi:phosphoenolpyruvate-protein phosphotransferase